MRGSTRTRIGRAAAAVLLALSSLALGDVTQPPAAAAAYCDDFPFLCLTYTVQPFGNGAGTVTTSDGFINCRWANGAKSGTCSKRYVKDQDGRVHVPLTLTADPGSYACHVPYCELETVQITPIISGDFTDYSPKFALDACTPDVTTWCSNVTFQLTGAAGGSIETTDGYIDCSRANGATTGTCSHQYFVGPTGSTIPLQWAYVAPPGVRMCEDADNCDSGSGTVTRTLQPYSDRVFTFSFEFYVYTLTVATGGSGAGSVTSAPSGISCGATCSDTYHYDDAVRLTATPQAGSRFESWTGPCAGQDAMCDLKVRDSATIVATFLPVGATSPPAATPKPGTSALPGATGSPGTTALPGTSPSASGPPASGGGSVTEGPDTSGDASSDAPPASGATPAPAPVGQADVTGGPDIALLALAVLAGAVIIAIGLAVGLRGRRAPRDEDAPAA